VTAVLAGLLAALFSFFANGLALRSYGPLAAVWAVPLLEETAKTLTAFLLGVPLLLTHGVFGLTEALHDSFSRRGRAGLAPFLSLGGHLAFGGVTQGVYGLTGVLGYGIAAAAGLHILWNLGTGLITGGGGKKKA
jgi:hypothetical protein